MKQSSRAHEGDSDAIDTVLSHYAGYIRYCSKVHGKVNAEVEEHIKQKANRRIVQVSL